MKEATINIGQLSDAVTNRLAYLKKKSVAKMIAKCTANRKKRKAKKKQK